eukprot:TRINITY_DN10566_c0_g1_i1.p1 TRINITY_DN10566_c0_g1~~TRINITY_DN10566_c0_g1_i1.p1  ORF type:complete len:268 (+),score=56.74 TRINITY_DN10566_c0_g1_i1:226-1029(+)
MNSKIKNNRNLKQTFRIMGRPIESKDQSSSSSLFRFTKSEVEQMERAKKDRKKYPTRDEIKSLVAKFNSAPERRCKIPVQYKQVQSWFYKHASSSSKGAVAQSVACIPMDTHSDESDNFSSVESLSAMELSRKTPYQFEAKSSKDGAWYDVACFLEHRMLEPGDPDVLVRFEGYGADHDEWVNVKSSIRERSIPCEDSDCVCISPGDHVLCFREDGKQAIYFDACVLDVERRRHDIRGCRCKFLVCYENDHAQERLPLHRIYRRPTS